MAETDDTPQELAERFANAERHIRWMHPDRELQSGLTSLTRVLARSWIGGDPSLREPSRKAVSDLLDEAYYEEGCCTWRD